jgi:hypothetical protein
MFLQNCPPLNPSKGNGDLEMAIPDGNFMLGSQGKKPTI